MGEDEKRRNNKNEKTKTVVWDAIRTALKPEKNIWAAEIEIYPLVTSNGPPVYGKNCKMVSPLLDFGPLWHRHIVDSPNFDVLVSRKALKARISSSKINFGSNFVKNATLNIFAFQKIPIPFYTHFLIFLTFSDFAQKWKFWWFSIILVPFWS